MALHGSLGRLRLALLAALGGGAMTACTGNASDDTRQPGTSDGGPEAGGSGGETGASGGAGTGGATGTGGGGSATGGASNGGAGGRDAGGGDGGAAPDVCVNPVPVTSILTGAGPSGGFVRCESGLVHRPDTGQCWSAIGAPDAGPPIPNAPDGSFPIDCRTNSDCTAAPRGYCAQAPSYGLAMPQGFVCTYGCVDDSECESGQICRCGDPVGTCVTALCKADGDCESGQLCRETFVLPACGPSIAEFRCEPRCAVDADCPSDMVCRAGNCQSQAVCGRPFLVGGRSVLASAERRGDWGASPAPDVSDLSPDVRRALAKHYAEIGLMEHASIAAFARFSLELLSMAAPADLMQLAAEAMADETRHARVAFGLAAAYGGAELGPGPLALGSALAATSLDERVETAFLEACIGETLAAAEVAEAAERAADPIVSGLLAGIATDEARHAALGFRFVAWALQTLEPDARSALEARLLSALDREIGAPGPSPEAGCGGDARSSAALARHGILPDSIRAELRRAALRDVVVPCVHAMLNRPAARLAA